MKTNPELLPTFMDFMKEKKRLFYGSIKKTGEAYPELFEQLGNRLLTMAKKSLGEPYLQILADGYAAFVMDVNKSQTAYEKSGKYLHSSYQQVYEAVYNNQDFMNLYHWGVFVTTFCWKHHLDIFSFFQRQFLPYLSSRDGGPSAQIYPTKGDVPANRPDGDVLAGLTKNGSLNAAAGRKQAIEFGCGSGIWGFSFLEALPEWEVTGIDISETSIQLAKKMFDHMEIKDRVHHLVGDALAFSSERQFEAVFSCFLLEHLEQPQQLLQVMANNLKPRGYAFLTCALTAAEIDHIAEFKNESEIILLAEKNGFRVISSFSAAPESHQENARFLPRSMALVMQKRRNDIW